MSRLSNELGYLARQDLSLILDNESPRGHDWRGLADRMGFSNNMVLLLKHKSSPTQSLLEEWERNLGAEATLGKLIGLVEQLDCMEAVDILKKAKGTRRELLCTRESISSCDSGLASSFEEDKDSNHSYTNCNSLDSSHLCSQSGEDQLITEKMQKMNVDSVKQPKSPDRGGKEKLERALQYIRRQKYDVFLSFAQEDEEFAEEVRQRLMTQANLRVFVPSEGLVAGKVYSEQIAEMIKKGCRKTVVILSPHYIESPWCRYEAHHALHASPGAKKHILIPVLYQSCEVPTFMDQLYYLSYPRYKDNQQQCQKYFWKRLYEALA